MYQYIRFLGLLANEIIHMYDGGNVGVSVIVV